MTNVGTPKLNSLFYKRLFSSIPPDWTRASCKGLYVDEVFFPEHGTKSMNKVAQRICFKCPIRADCLKYALDNKILFGIWGGTTPLERQDILGL